MEPQASTSQSIRSPPSVLKRRDKRRLPSATFDLKDPYETISLAISLDAQLDDEFLRVPLKSANMNDTNLFIDAYSFITKVRSQKIVEPKDLPQAMQGIAFTPIILSGLLSYNDVTISASLISYCQRNRNLAIRKNQMARQQARIRNIILPAVSMLILLSMHYYQADKVVKTIQQLGLHSSCADDESFGDRCFRRDAILWKSYREYGLRMRGQSCPDASICTHTILHSRFPGSVLDLYTPFQNDVLNSNGEIVRSSRSSLGDSVLDRLVVEAVASVSNNTDSSTILHIGAGLGSTMYALAERGAVKNMLYQGVTSSRFEKSLFESFLQFYEATIDRWKYERHVKVIKIDVATPEYKESGGASVGIAVEALSRNTFLLEDIVAFVNTLRSGGRMIFVDIFRYESQEIPGFPSLVQVSTLSTVLGTAGCVVEEVADVSLEYSYLDWNRRSFDWDWFFIRPWGWLTIPSARSDAFQWALRVEREYSSIVMKEESLQQLLISGVLGHTLVVCNKE